MHANQHFENPLFDGIAEAINDRLAEPLDEEVLELMIRRMGEQDLWNEFVGPMLDGIMAKLGLDTPTQQFEDRWGCSPIDAARRIAEFTSSYPGEADKVCADSYRYDLEELGRSVAYCRAKGWAIP